MTVVFWFPSPSQFRKYDYLILPFYAPHPRSSFSNPDRAVHCLGEEPVHQLNVRKFYLYC